jgi:hypothetical protein
MTEFTLSVIVSDGNGVGWTHVDPVSGKTIALSHIPLKARLPRMHFSGDRKYACLYDFNNPSMSFIYNLTTNGITQLPKVNGARVGDIFFDQDNTPSAMRDNLGRERRTTT